MSNITRISPISCFFSPKTKHKYIDLKRWRISKLSTDSNFGTPILQSFVQPRLWFGDEHPRWTNYRGFFCHISYLLAQRKETAQRGQISPGAGTKELPNREKRKAELEQPTGKLSLSFHRSQQATELKRKLTQWELLIQQLWMKENCISSSSTTIQIKQKVFSGLKHIHIFSSLPWTKV